MSRRPCAAPSIATLPGQAQKEYYVNEAHALADALMHCAVEGVADIPPAEPSDGTCWLVGPAPSGEWAEQAGKVACRQLGNWLFVTPRDGMTVVDRSSGQTLRHLAGWRAPAPPAVPVGGAMPDTELRAAFAALLAALGQAGIFAT